MLFHSKTLLLKSIKTKNKLYKKHLQVPTVDNASLYKRYKNKLNDTLRLAKRRYYEKKLEDAKSNTHATWKILNEVLNRKMTRPQLNTIFKSDGKEISDPEKVANRFARFTATSLVLVRTSQRKYSLPLLHIKIFYVDHFENQSFFSPTTEDEIITIAESFASGKAAKYNNISMTIIKESIQIISEPEFVNRSWRCPDQMKKFVWYQCLKLMTSHYSATIGLSRFYQAFQNF